MRSFGKDKIKVAQVLEATIGGTKKHIINIAKYLDKEKFSVTIICSIKRDESFENDIKDMLQHGVSVKIVNMSRNIDIIHDMIALIKIAAIFKSERFDIVHAHSSKAGLLARIAAKISNIPLVIYSPHAFYFQANAGCTRKCLMLYEKLFSLFTNVIITVSKGEKDVALKCSICKSEKLIVIENGIDIKECNSSENIAKLRRNIGIHSGKHVVGTVCRICKQKGYRYFILSCREVVRKIPNTVFVLVGDGEDLQNARNMIDEYGIRDNFILTGFQKNVYRYYALFDVFVLASLWEGMPYVVIEAMAMCKPVVASRITGNEDIVKHGETGYLFEPGDVKQMSEMIIELLQNKEAAARMGTRGREIIENRFLVQTQIQKLENTYENLLKN